MVFRGFEQRILNLFRISIFGFGDFAPLKRTGYFLTLPKRCRDGPISDESLPLPESSRATRARLPQRSLPNALSPTLSSQRSFRI